MWEWLQNLFKGSVAATPPPKPAPKAPAEPEGARKLTPLDAPMITARIRVLGLLDQIDERYHSQLDRLIKARCRDGRTEPWWGPLKVFADERRTGSEGNTCFQSFAAESKNLGVLSRDIVALEAMVRGRRFQFIDLLDRNGDAIFPDDKPSDGEYRVQYRAGDKESHFVVHIEGGEFDVAELVGTLNRMLRGFKWPDRFFLLGPHDGCFGIVHAAEPTARKAHDIGWGRLIYAER